MLTANPVCPEIVPSTPEHFPNTDRCDRSALLEKMDKESRLPSLGTTSLAGLWGGSNAWVSYPGTFANLNFSSAASNAFCVAGYVWCVVIVCCICFVDFSFVAVRSCKLTRDTSFCPLAQFLTCFRKNETNSCVQGVLSGMETGNVREAHLRLRCELGRVAPQVPDRGLRGRVSTPLCVNILLP